MSIGSASIGPQGLGQSTLELLADERKLNKTLASLRTAQENAQKAIDLAGPATEIVAIRAQVGAELQKSQEVTAQAEKAGAEKIAAAEAEANEITSDAQQKAASIISAAEAGKDDAAKEVADAYRGIDSEKNKLQTQRDQITKAQDQLDEKAADLDNVEADLNARSVEIDKIKDGLLKEKTRLAEAREHLSAALG